MFQEKRDREDRCLRWKTLELSESSINWSTNFSFWKITSKLGIYHDFFILKIYFKFGLYLKTYSKEKNVLIWYFGNLVIPGLVQNKEYSKIRALKLCYTHQIYPSSENTFFYLFYGKLCPDSLSQVHVLGSWHYPAGEMFCGCSPLQTFSSCIWKKSNPCSCKYIFRTKKNKYFFPCNVLYWKLKLQWAKILRSPLPGCDLPRERLNYCDLPSWEASFESLTDRDKQSTAK